MVLGGMYRLALLIVVLGAGSAYGDDYSWLQGSWMSDPDRTLKANPETDAFPEETRVSFREMLGKTNWVINDLELSISHPRFDSTSFTISGLRTLRDGKVEFNAFPDGGAFALERTDFGFCAGWRS
jgi:hypothetical protein